MADHPYSIGDEVLIRGTVVRHSWDDKPIIQPSSGGNEIAVSPSSITQSTPGEPTNEKSIIIDRHGWSWQKIAGQWQQGDVEHKWVYLLEHHGPVKVVYRGEE